MRIVVDTSVLLCGLLSRRGASHQVIRAVFDRRHVLVASVPTFLEYEAVLERRENLERIGWSPTESRSFLAGLAALIDPVEISFLWRPGFASIGDEPFVEVAAAGAADALISFNVRDVLLPGRRFRFSVETPGEFLRRERKGRCP